MSLFVSHMNTGTNIHDIVLLLVISLPLYTIVHIGAISISPVGPIIKASQESFSLYCSLPFSNPLPQGVSAPELVWFFNSTNSTFPHGVTMANTMSMTGNASISSLTFSPPLESHTGIYTCQIEGNGRQVATIMITVFSIQIYYSNYSPMAGELYYLTCNVSESVNVTSYQWKKDGQEILNKAGVILLFPLLLLSDAGEYTCEAEVNSINYSTNRTIMLDSRFH